MITYGMLMNQFTRYHIDEDVPSDDTGGTGGTKELDAGYYFKAVEELLRLICESLVIHL